MAMTGAAIQGMLSGPDLPSHTPPALETPASRGRFRFTSPVDAPGVLIVNVC